MSIANLKLDESAKLEFDVLITGADGLPTSRFVIEGKDYSISFPCRQVGEGVEVDVAGLKNVLPAGEYPVRLEIVLENKIYTPMQDTITLEPVVEINTKSKPVAQVKEAVKVVGKVNVTKTPTISEETQNRINAAMKVAEVLGFVPPLSFQPTQIVEAALMTIEELPREELIALEKTLMAAEYHGVEFDRSLTPKLMEAKKQEEEKEDVEDTADYKTSASGKKVRAHKIVFNKGEEEPHVNEESSKHRVQVTISEPDHPSVAARKVTKQKFVRVSAVNKDEACAKATSHYKKQGYKVHGAECVGTISEEDELNEKLSSSDPIDKWISDFVHSDDKRFAGKTKDERIKMAKGAYYASQRSEDVERVGSGRVNESPLAKNLIRTILNK